MNDIENNTTETVTKPRIAIMGEFSVGKSTLTNLLIGSEPLPVQVTATQLPPVWISHGDQDPYREDLEGNQFPVDLKRLSDVPIDQTAVIRIFLKSDILELCDLIDMPGISDPNMPADVWQRMLHHADGVLWCTHATQAWRQSEAAVWKSLSEDLFDKSLLLITRIDKLLTERDRQRVVKRVRRETDGMFAGIFPISLTEAISAKDDRDLWDLSGAEAFSQSLVDLVHELSGQADSNVFASTTVRPSASIPGDNLFQLSAASPVTPKDAVKVVPKRVRVQVQTATTRRPPASGLPDAAVSAQGQGLARGAALPEMH